MKFEQPIVSVMRSVETILALAQCKEEINVGILPMRKEQRRKEKTISETLILISEAL